ncbi:MAG: hypothetical protein GY810_16320 [Aureispira sp.]|nr:hypothetical protein [Aureispira sp.]
MPTQKDLVKLCKGIQTWSKIYLQNPKAFGAEGAKKFEEYKSIYSGVGNYLQKNAPKSTKREQGGGVSVRIPALEVFAQQAGAVSAALSDSIRPLTGPERKIAEFVFQTSLRLDEIRIEEEALIANAPTTLGNVIRLSKGYTMSDATLVHELTHVWQFQNKGTGYISNSVINQVGGMIGSGDRNAAYVVTIEQGKPFSSYSAEHQGTIVEDWYAKANLRNDPEYQRLIAEVRGATPPIQLDLTQTYTETMYGVQTENDRLQEMMQPDFMKDVPKVPGNILRVEF